MEHDFSSHFHLQAVFTQESRSLRQQYGRAQCLNLLLQSKMLEISFEKKNQEEENSSKRS